MSVVTKENDKHIGVVSLSFINWVHRYADVAIVIGEKDYNKGTYSIEAFSLILKVAFIRLNLRTIKSGYANSNEASRTIHRVFKFNKVGEYKNLLCKKKRTNRLVLTMSAPHVFFQIVP